MKNPSFNHLQFNFRQCFLWGQLSVIARCCPALPNRPESLFEKFGVKYKLIDAKKIFLDNLKGVVDPETKRKIIGKTFIDVFKKEAETFGATYLLQGTIAPNPALKRCPSSRQVYLSF